MNQTKLDMRPNAQSHDSVSSWQSLSDAYMKREQMREVCCTLLFRLKPEDTAVRKAESPAQTWCVAVAVLGLVDAAHGHTIVLIHLQGPAHAQHFCLFTLETAARFTISTVYTCVKAEVRMHAINE